MNNVDIICFGEVLWDVFPSEKFMGGAPLNVAVRAREFGCKTGLISAVGDDFLGNNILHFLEDKKVCTAFITKNQSLPTGTVSITLDEIGDAQYNINKPVAWDKIILNNSVLQKVNQAKILVFGSLSARSSTNYNGLKKLIENANFCVFDVNLRPPFIDFIKIEYLLKKADFVKVNEDELYEICNHFNLNLNTLEAQANALKNHINTKYLCVTLGSKGALLIFENQIYTASGMVVEVVDAVGAGDSFLASLLVSLFLEKKSITFALKKACIVGAMVASQAGATTPINRSKLKTALNE